MSFFFIKLKFYIVWLLAESVNNASGFGFNGFDRNGEPKWDLLTNVNIIELEVIKFYVSILLFLNKLIN